MVVVVPSDTLFVIYVHVGATSIHAAVIPPRKYPIPSELGSQAWLGSISTGMRDLLGTPSAAVFCQFRLESPPNHLVGGRHAGG
jgi:hypothetical protein